MRAVSWKEFALGVSLLGISALMVWALVNAYKTGGDAGEQDSDGDDENGDQLSNKFAGLLGWADPNDRTFEFNTTALRIIEQTLPPKEWTGLLLGGWCCCNDHCITGGWKIGNLGNTICPMSGRADLRTYCGSFAEQKVYKHRLYTIGGDNVGASTPELLLNVERVKNCAEIADANGLIFDYEPPLSNHSIDEIEAFIREYRIGAKPDMKYIFCYIEGLTTPPPPGGEFTHICPMLYAAEFSYQQGHYQVQSVNGCIAALREKGWRKDQIILTFQAKAVTVAGNRGKRWLEELVKLTLGQTETMAEIDT